MATLSGRTPAASYTELLRIEPSPGGSRNVEDGSGTVQPIHLDVSNGRLGVMNANPAVPLDVTGAATASGLITGSAGLTITGADFSMDGDINFVGPQSVSTSSGNLTLAPSGGVAIGANAIITSSLSVIEKTISGQVLAVRNAADSAAASIAAHTYFCEVGGISFEGTNGQSISAPNADAWHMGFKARDTGVGLVEVGRMAGGADPYFSFGGGQQFKFSNGGQAGFFSAALTAQPAHIADADGNLADITTKFNTLLAQLATLGLQAAS